MTSDYLIEEVVEEMAPLTGLCTHRTVLTIRGIIREALQKYEAKLREGRIDNE